MVGEKEGCIDIERERDSDSLRQTEDNMSLPECLYFLAEPRSHLPRHPTRIKSTTARSVQAVCLLVGKSALRPLPNAFKTSETRQEEHQTLFR